MLTFINGEFKMKKFVVQNPEGKFLRKTLKASRVNREWMDNVWESTLFDSEKEAASSKAQCLGKDEGSVLTTEVRVKLEK